MKYKGYTGCLVVDEEAGILYGRVANINDVITFQGATVAEARQAFQDSIDDYLAFCTQLGEEPELPLSGKLTLHTSPQRHRKLHLAAIRQGKSLTTWIDDTLAEAADKVLHEADQVESPAASVVAP